MALEKFSAQADEELLEEVRELAANEGTKLYTLINEAFSDLLDKHKHAKPRQAVLDQFEASLSEYDRLYEKLAK